MRRARVLAFTAFAAAVFASARASAADFNVTMTTDSGGHFVWSVNGQINPQLTLTRGTTYTFQVQAPGHPFDIKTAQVTGTGSQYPGVTGQGVTSGTLTFPVPTDPNAAPPFYQCEVHATMTGVIQLASATAAPALGPWGSALLSLAFLVAGAGALHTRRRSVA
jgi:hypothetical protein